MTNYDNFPSGCSLLICEGLCPVGTFLKRSFLYYFLYFDPNPDDYGNVYMSAFIRKESLSWLR